MPIKTLFRLTLLSLGIALLLAGLFFENSAAARAPQAGTPIASPLGTPDRLAEPTLPALPSQADLGAQVYWLSCMPCHGDRGQGLTEEFRQTYPPEDQYCWNSGCHGERPYENGFKLPKFIPAVVGPVALAKFTDGAQLEAYIRAAMPFWKPGSLSDEDAWKVTAFILRSNGLWAGVGELNADNASQVKIQRGAPTPEATPISQTVPFSLVGVGVIALAVAVLVTLSYFRLRKN